MIQEEDLLFKEDHIQSESKETFYEYMKANGIDFDDIDPDDRMPKFMVKVIKNEPAEYNKFNNVIYKLNKNNQVSIIDAIVYIIEDWLEPTILIKCLDELNFYTLSNALRNKHNLNRLLSSGLNDIFT